MPAVKNWQFTKISSFPGFEWVCRQKGWNASDTWKELNGDSTWFKAPTQVSLYSIIQRIYFGNLLPQIFYSAPVTEIYLSRPTYTGTSQTVCGGSTSLVGTEFTLRRLPLGLRHRLAGRLSDPSGLCLALLPHLETFETESEKPL